MKLETTGGLRAWLERLLSRGEGSCSRCRRPWSLPLPLASQYGVLGHTTVFRRAGTSEYGCFPLCEGCWQELETAARRLPYYWDWWERLGAMQVGWADLCQAIYREADELLLDDDPFDPPPPPAEPPGPRQRLSSFAD